jgi:hypothetical protein
LLEDLAVKWLQLALDLRRPAPSSKPTRTADRKRIDVVVAPRPLADVIVFDAVALIRAAVVAVVAVVASGVLGAAVSVASC